MMYVPHRFELKVGLLFLLGLFLLACDGQELSQHAPAGNNRQAENPGDVQAEAVIVIEDVSQLLQVKPSFSNGEESDQFTYLEAMGGGLGVLDFDKDGWPDLFFPGGGKIPDAGRISPLPGKLLRNRIGKQFVDVSGSAMVDRARYSTQGVAVADINSDGFPELLVTGYGGIDLFANQGDGTFVQVADEMELTDPLWSSSAGFGDFDADGLLDLFVAHYVDWSWENHPLCNSTSGVRDICPPAAFKGQPDCLFINQGEGTFGRHEADIGLLPEGKGLGVVCADLNQDGKLDVYVANDTNNNYLYINQGRGKFKELGVDSGSALDNQGVANGSMGVAVLDYDGNLTPDLWVCNYEDETFALYKNDGGANFRFVSSSAGITALGTLFVAFGTIAADLDRDGDEDLLVANGHVLRYPSGNSVAQLPLLLRNNGKGRFIKQAFPDNHYFSKAWRGRGLAKLDFDCDGDMDLVFSNVNQPSAIIENRTASNCNWCNIELVGRSSNRDAIGSQVTFTTQAESSNHKYARWVCGGGSYLSQSSYQVHWACPANEKLVQIEIKWPSGNVQVLQDVVSNQRHIIVEPN